MAARRLAIGAAALTLAAAGCGGDKPLPFKEVEKPAATATTPSVAVGEPAPGGDALAALGARQRAALAPVVAAQRGLVQRGDALARAGMDADKVVQRVHAGYAAPSGSTPEVGRLADALGAFATALNGFATRADLLPQMSSQLKLRYARLVKTRPHVAAHVLEAKQEVDAIVAELPRQGKAVEDAAAQARSQSKEDTLDADTLETAISAGSAGATSALNGVNQAIDAGVAALAAA